MDSLPELSFGWPFWGFAFVLSVVGEVMTRRVFTRARAYTRGRARALWFWGRETLPLHPIAAGALFGCFWRAPEGTELPLVGSALYFGFSGGLSLVAWVVLRGVAKSRGIDLRLPGESTPPEGK